LDPTQPAAWSAEGLMPFLPPEAQDALLDNITALSAAGSRLATENVPDAGQAVPVMAERMRQVTDRWRDHGLRRGDDRPVVWRRSQRRARLLE
jgi:O-methyltransferase involved in polyketide biosynthesis